MSMFSWQPTASGSIWKPKLHARKKGPLILLSTRANWVATSQRWKTTLSRRLRRRNGSADGRMKELIRSREMRTLAIGLGVN